MDFDSTGRGGDGVYHFYTIATDAAGNAEPTPVEPDCTVGVRTDGEGSTRASRLWVLYE